MEIRILTYFVWASVAVGCTKLTKWYRFWMLEKYTQRFSFKMLRCLVTRYHDLKVGKKSVILQILGPNTGLKQKTSNAGNAKFIVWKMTKNPGHIPDINMHCPEHDQESWSYSEHR